MHGIVICNMAIRIFLSDCTYIHIIVARGMTGSYVMISIGIRQAFSRVIFNFTYSVNVFWQYCRYPLETHGTVRDVGKERATGAIAPS